MHKKYLNLDTVIDIVESDPELHDSHKSQIIEKMQAHGIPRNPLYDMGANRVGCYPCINCRKEEIRYMAEYRQERIDHIAAWEAKIDSTFFRRNTTPERHRSKLITTVAGEEMRVPTIHDVVQWSRTKRGGKQYEFFLPDNQISACDIGGMCE